MEFAGIDALSRFKGKISPDFDGFQPLPQKWFGKKMAQFSKQVVLREGKNPSAEIDLSSFLESGEYAFFVDVSGVYRLDDFFYPITGSDENLSMYITGNTVYLEVIPSGSSIIIGYVKIIKVYLNAKFYIDDVSNT
jgi:hypothetical protein